MEAFAREMVGKGLVLPERESEFIDLASAFFKKKKSLAPIDSTNRCKAKRSNGMPCSRRQITNSTFCGLHHRRISIEKLNGHTDPVDENTIPSNESFSNDVSLVEEIVTVDVVAEEIQGIVYYIDAFQNIYRTEDILKGLTNPKIVGRCEKLGQSYYIPEDGIEMSI